jgi:oxalyl-CoA decarboxylase
VAGWTEEAHDWIGVDVIDGYRLVARALRVQGATEMYGVVGIPVTALAEAGQAEGIRYFGFRNEQAAGHAAAAAGYLTRSPGICLTVSAPGFLNGLVAAANATTNCWPMILISGSSQREIVDLERGDYEEMDQLARAKPLVKDAFRVETLADVGDGVARAYRTALSGRPGAVYLDVPGALLHQAGDEDGPLAVLAPLVDPIPRTAPDPAAIDRAVGLLHGARRPLIVFGKGAAYERVEEQARDLVQRTGIPFFPMSMAKGLVPDDHPRSAATARAYAFGNADVVLVVGARLNWLLEHGRPPLWAADGRIIQIDVAGEEMDSNRHVDAPIVSSIGPALGALLARLADEPMATDTAWTEALAEEEQRNVAKFAAASGGDPVPMVFTNAYRAIRDVLAGHPDAILVSEGANTLDVGRNLVPMSQPRKRLDVGTWGTMGVGLGFAIAAATVTDAPVVAVEGDSALGFSGMELETICRYELPVTVVVMNNGGIYKGDAVGPAPGEPAPTRLGAHTRYDQIMTAVGGTGVHVRTSAELADALQTAMSSGLPTLIDAEIDPTAGTESGHLTKMN